MDHASYDNNIFLGLPFLTWHIYIYTIYIYLAMISFLSYFSKIFFSFISYIHIYIYHNENT